MLLVLRFFGRGCEPANSRGNIYVGENFDARRFQLQRPAPQRLF